MPINTYAALQLTVAQFINRGDLSVIPPGNTTTPIQDAIVLAEAKIQRKLRRVTVRNSSVAIPPLVDQVQLPSDVAELRTVNLVTGDPTNDVSLIIVTVANLADYRAMFADVPMRPQYASLISGQNMMLVPTPDTNYVADITYYQNLQTLSASNPTNVIFLESPDLYLYGALSEMEGYLEHDERIPTWKGLFQECLDDLEVVKEREELGAGIRITRLPYSGFFNPF